MFEASFVVGRVALQPPLAEPAAGDRLFGFVVVGTAFFLLWWGMTYITRRQGGQILVSCDGAVLVWTLIMIVLANQGLGPLTR